MINDYTKGLSSNNLLSIALEFIKKIDKNLINFNLKFAYFCYIYALQFNVPKAYIKKFIMLALFNDVGKLYAKDRELDSTFETYIFMKYFSPFYDSARILLLDETNVVERKYIICKKYTENYILLSDAAKALDKTIEENKFLSKIEIYKLNQMCESGNIDYEINSMRYKTILFSFISKTFDSPIKKNRFILMLSSLFEMYSSQTLSHSKTTAFIATTLAKKLNLDEIRQKNLYIAGLVHDLGKVCIPLSILEKDSKLSDDEFKIMKTHVQYTYEIIHNYLDYEIVELAYRHHEKLDGSGYPNSYKAQVLTLDQRILCVADVSSALLMKRSYKDAYSWENSASILMEEVKNNKLDKEVVNCLINNKDDILSVIDNVYTSNIETYQKIQKEREKFYKK